MHARKLSAGLAMLGLTAALAACTTAQAGQLPEAQTEQSTLMPESGVAIPRQDANDSAGGAVSGPTVVGKTNSTPVSAERERVVSEAVTRHLLAVEGVQVQRIKVMNEFPDSSSAQAVILHHGVRKTILLTAMPDTNGWHVVDAQQIS